MSTVSYYWRKDTKAVVVLLDWNQDYSFLGRNFIKVRNIMGMDIKGKDRVFFCFSSTFFSPKYPFVAFSLYIPHEMRSDHPSYLLNPGL